MTQEAIKLGPILGIEGDYSYTVSFVSQSDLDPADVTLELNGPEGAATLCFDSKERLHSTFLYKVAFNVAQLAASFTMSYIVAHDGQPMTNKSGSRHQFVTGDTALADGAGVDVAHLGNAKQGLRRISFKALVAGKNRIGHIRTLWVAGLRQYASARRCLLHSWQF